MLIRYYIAGAILMIGKECELKRIAPIAEVLEILEERRKYGEFGYEQQLAYDYAKKFSKLESKQAEKLKEELKGLGISEKSAISIVNIFPAESAQLRQILASEKNTVEESIVNKTMETLESYRGK
jgi:DNA-directed RNA polymerase subunit F